MKSVLISIQPKWVEKIASGEKTIEVRKTEPKLERPFKCYIYCTKKDYDKVFCVDKFMHKVFLNGKGKGKVIGEFVCDRIDDLKYVPTAYYGKPAGTYEEMICRASCLTVEKIKDYAKGGNIYGWYITNLKIYDKPKDLSEFWHIKCTNKRNGCLGCEVKPKCIKTITRPPQSWCYVEEVEQ